MKKLLIAFCVMIFSAFAVQAAPGGPGSGCYIGPSGSFHGQSEKETASLNVDAAARNANFERLCGNGAATVAAAGKSTYSKTAVPTIAATSNGVLGGGSIGISKEATGV